MRVVSITSRMMLPVVAVSLACTPSGTSDAPADGPPLPPGVSGEALPMTTPENVGLSAEGLAHIGPAMQGLIDEGHAAGIMTMIARNGRIAHWESRGVRDLESGAPLQPDDLFRIYSMTKPVTSVAVMMLVEEGQVALDDPVSKFIPAFADLMVMEEDESLRPPSTAMTVSHLLTHTSGLTYGFFGDSEVDRLYARSGLFMSPTLDAFIDNLAALPLLHDPGTVWNYSVSTDVLGAIVEVASGQAFPEFLHERIFVPLGMDDTAFWVPEEDRARFASHYAPSDDGLALRDGPDGQYAQMPGMASGGGGLVSTGSDYIRFAQMLLQDGELDGVRILQTETVRSMRSDHLPEGHGYIDFPGWMGDGYGFGLGFATLVDAEASAPPDNDGLFRWGGIANTFFLIDPEAELIGMVWAQFDPFLGHGMERTFQELVYGAVQD